jgi:hypothetical protein
MPVPRHADLLAELDPLSHGERLRRAADLARAHAGDPALAALVDALLAGDAYEASLAVTLAQAVRDLPRLAAALRHRSLGVRRQALAYLVPAAPDRPAPARPVPSDTPHSPVPSDTPHSPVPSDTSVPSDTPHSPVPSDTSVPSDTPHSPVPSDTSAPPDLAAEILGLAPALRRWALRELVRAGRRGLAAALFPELLARHGPREAVGLLPLLPADELRRRLPELAHAGPRWRSLVLRHPDLATDHLRGRLAAATPRERPRVWHLHGDLVRALAELRPRDLFDLLEAHPDTIPVPLLLRLDRELARADPGRLLAALEQPTARAHLACGLPRSLLRQIRRFSPAGRLRLARLVAERPDRLAELLAVVAPAAREALLDGACPDVDPARVWPDVLLEALPRARRRREAARMLALPAVRADPDRTLALTAFLALDDARPALQRACQAADADERGRGVARLIACAGRSGPLHAVLEHLLPRLKNEQDPVRLQALQALARAPVAAFTADDARPLTALLRHVTEARDTSHATRSAGQQLAFRLLRGHAVATPALFDAGLDLLRLLAGQTGALVLPDLSRGLPRRTGPALVAALAPRIAAATARERPDLVLALATALGRRGHGLPALTALLEPLTTARPEHVASRAIGLLLGDPRGRDERVRALLAWDRSVIAIPQVLAHLHRRRQAWLDPFLDGAAIKGRFLSGKTVYVLPVHDGFHRWLPRQQRAFARVIVRAAGDPGHAHHARAQVIAQLARLPVTGVADFAAYLQGDEVPVIEAALGALAWIDAPAEALPVLLEHAAGDRARVAMYAVPRVARFVDAAALARTLTALVLDEGRKLTVRKEALRLLGQHRGPASVPAIAAVLARDDVHRDLRIAAGHAARSLLDDPRALGLLAPLAGAGDPDLARSLLDASPGQLPAAARRGYAALVLAVAAHPDLTARRAAIRALPDWSAGQEARVADHLADLVLDTATVDVWQDAVPALVAVAGDLAARASAATSDLADASPGRAATSDLADASPGRAAGDPPAALVRVLAGLAADDRDPDPDARDLPARQRLLAVHAALCGLPRARRLSFGTAWAALADRLAADELWPLAAGLRLAGLDLAADPAADLLALAADARADLFLDELVACLSGQVADAGPALAPAGLLALADRLAVGPPPAARLALALVAAAGARAAWPADARARLAALRAHPDLRVRAAARRVFARPEAPLTSS